MGLSEFLEIKEPDVECLFDPKPEDAARLIHKRRTSHVIVIYGELIAYYEGRAKSRLDELMPRIVITKPDGTFMIHEAEKREPRLWNPSPSHLYVTVENGVLTLKSVRQNPREVVIVEMPVIRFVGAFRLGFTEDYRVIGREEDIVNAILKNPSIIEDGLRVIATEYHTTFGDIDVLARDVRGNTVVIECKRSRAGPEAVSQLKRYVDYMRLREGERVRGILVAPSISTNAYRLLKMYGLEFRRIEPKALGDKGH